jgi:dihydroorotate dehydrogenase electron transfer subunit
MLKAVSALCERSKAPCEVSVEVPMACGFGACLGCAVKVKKERGEYRFAIACTEGPVFPASQLVWE